MNPKLKPAGMITLVNKASTTIYSGMFPGVVAGKYKIDEILIDLRKLASKAGVSFVMAEIEGINLKDKKLLLAGRPEIEYSLLSLNVVTKTNLNSKSLIRGDKDLAVPIKPFFESYKFIVDQDIHKDNSSANPFAIIGGGFAGIEIAFSLRKRWPDRSIILKVKSLRKLSENLLKSLGFILVFVPIFKDNSEYSISGRPAKSNFFSLRLIPSISAITNETPAFEASCLKSISISSILYLPATTPGNIPE